MPQANPPEPSGGFSLPAALAAKAGDVTGETPPDSKNPDPLKTVQPKPGGPQGGLDAMPLSPNMDDIPDPPPAAVTTAGAMKDSSGKTDPSLFQTTPPSAFDPPASKAATGRPATKEAAKQQQQAKVMARQKDEDGVEIEGKLNLYKVSLEVVKSPEYVVAAEDRLAAIEVYNELCGITNAPNTHSIAEAGKEM